MSEQNNLFFIFFTKNIPPYYFQISQFLNLEGINLIPLTLRQVKEGIQHEKRPHLICVIRDIKEKKLYERYLKTYLELSSRNKKITFHHISSFNEMEQSYVAKKTGHYFFYKLPFKLRDFVKNLMINLQKKTQTVSQWPGGKRVGIPFDMETPENKK